MKPARFFALDARAAFPIVLLLFNLRIWTLVLTIVVISLFWIGERFGLRFEAALRAVRAWLVVPHRPAQAFQLNRRMVDLSGIEAGGINPKIDTIAPTQTK